MIMRIIFEIVSLFGLLSFLQVQVGVPYFIAFLRFSPLLYMRFNILGPYLVTLKNLFGMQQPMTLDLYAKIFVTFIMLGIMMCCTVGEVDFD
jgi:hypothetical protein